ncbi:HotDog domain-containing protein [Russula earlei]|uniref:HotDog domain-containing protein n=1 Tax=Russula earlei TaxID=71964 RepID=A0ACC0U8U9_9AGAM|nr:HotDog domain-containing protein [Russula earlei]
MPVFKQDASAALTSDARIRGNLPPEVKHTVATILYDFVSRPGVFGASVGHRVVITEASTVPKAEEPSRSETRIVCEVNVTEDMLNPAGALHGACAAFLIDTCTTLVFIAAVRTPGVSASMDIVYHAPAAPGAKLRIVSTAMAVGARIMSARSEIWDDTAKRLCVTGIHIKMEPSAPKKNRQKL